MGCGGEDGGEEEGLASFHMITVTVFGYSWG